MPAENLNAGLAFATVEMAVYRFRRLTYLVVASAREAASALLSLERIGVRMMSYFIRVRHQSHIVLAMTIAALCAASAIHAQQFRNDPIDEAARRHGAKATRWVGNPGEYNNDKAIFTDYFQKYYFPAMTRSTPSELAELGKLRVDMFKKYLWATSNAQLQKDLTEMALRAMWKIVSNQQAPPYHPSVRYNAALVIGMLDSEYAVEGGANPRPPKPHPIATKALTMIVDQSTGKKYPPPVVLGALIGMERHAKYHQSLAPDAVKAMSTALLKFVNNKDPIQGVDPDAYNWLRFRAASALANLGSLGENNAVHDAFIQLIDTSKSLDDRCSAAALLSTFKYDQAKVDAPATTKALFDLTRDLSAEELKRAQDLEKRGSGGYVESQPFTQNDPNATQDDGYPRRHVLARILNLGAGLKAVKPALPEESQKQVDAILAAFMPVAKAVTDEDTGVFGVADAVRKMSGAITVAIGAPEDEGDDADEFTAGEPAPAAADAAPAAEPPTAGSGAEASITPPAAPPASKEPPAEEPVDAPAATAPPDSAKN
jgi:hypothetical protein